jgi:phage protein D
LGTPIITPPKPLFKVFYNNKDISRDLSRALVDLVYKDAVIGKVDELEITLEDSDGNWRSSWYPQKGAILKLKIGYEDALADCGEFQIDEIELSGPPDTVKIKAVSARVTSAMRTVNKGAYESVTLKQIAEKIAAKHGLTVAGTFYTLRVERATQNDETDLAFLARLAGQFGYIFNVKGSTLVFSSVYDLEVGTPVVEIDRSQLMSYSIRDKSEGTYKSCVVKYSNPKTAQLVNYEYKTETLKNTDGVSYTQVTRGDVLKVHAKAENRGQAEAMAKAALHGKNSKQHAGNIVVEGFPLLVAGNNFELTGLGELSGKYNIETSTHRIDRGGGYVTELEIKRVGFVSLVKQKGKKRKVKPPKYTVQITN